MTSKTRIYLKLAKTHPRGRGQVYLVRCTTKPKAWSKGCHTFLVLSEQRKKTKKKKKYNQ